MGTRGPVPKRADRVLGHKSKADLERTVPEVPASPVAPALTGKVHTLAQALYESLADSPEAQFYTAAVWQRILIHVHVLSTLLEEQGNRGISSMLYAALQSDWKSFLIDPAEQRRLGIEVKAAAVENPNETRALATVTSLMDKLSG